MTGEHTMTWQPIETAPKDGTPILAVGKGYPEISIVAWHRGKWVGMCDGQRSIESQGDTWTEYHEPYVTHWMPLPPPPE